MEIHAGDSVKKVAKNPKTGQIEEIRGIVTWTDGEDSHVEVFDDVLKRFYGTDCKLIRIKNDTLRLI
jgi:hypothetical protein